MPTRHPLTISLTPELANLVASKVASGLYGSASEVIRAGLRLLAMDAEQGSPPRKDIGTAPQHVGLRAVRKESRHD
ncbi:MAG: type II toxin-antitoxin system ParD family antitoxin [Janthinobacterium lividum]